MIKKLLIKIAASAVLELLLAYAVKRLESVRSQEEKAKWENVVEFLLDAQRLGLPL